MVCWSQAVSTYCSHLGVSPGSSTPLGTFPLIFCHGLKTNLSNKAKCPLFSNKILLFIFLLITTINFYILLVSNSLIEVSAAFHKFILKCTVWHTFPFCLYTNAVISVISPWPVIQAFNTFSSTISIHRLCLAFSSYHL